MAFQDVKLPKYTKGEEIFNSVSHALGILFGIIAMAVFLIKAASVSSVAGSVVFAVSVILLYTASTLYHGVSKDSIKKIMRLIDHSVIFILISGTSIAISLVAVYPSNKPFALIMCILNILFTGIGTALTFIDQEKYKKVQMTLYMFVGWISAVLIYPLYKYVENPWSVIILIAVGGIVYTGGTAFYAIGKNKKYFHSIFHLFVLAGTILHFFAIYTLI